ncbi:hypothetical protein [uncultured Microbacterium sp.]|uniref:hypothetical protein n=1 Tax=uncultured Microbacterium sp. TaxID=191216 RepID=UPI0028D79B4C|nr:hypothetical protein [uncultured Microbacterium sp.]
MTPTGTVVEAIEELRDTFPDTNVTYVPDGQGGAWVTIEEVPIGTAYTVPTSWLVFQITFPYPEADVYPHFVRADLQRKDGHGHGVGFSVGAYGDGGVPAMQLSRRSNRLNPAVDTAATKALKVLRWLGEQ